MFTKWLVFIYGVILIALGLVGYFVMNSKASAIMGGGFGFLIIICSLLMFLHKRIGLLIATFLTLLLTGFFAYRFSMTRSLMPALLAVLSGAMLIILLLHYPRWKKK